MKKKRESTEIEEREREDSVARKQDISLVLINHLIHSLLLAHFSAVSSDCRLIYCKSVFIS